MSTGLIAGCGWLLAGVAGTYALLARYALARRSESAARACHELRGPLTAARLGLQLGSRGGELSPARLRAIDLELGRASLALDDLRRVRDPARLDRIVEDVEVAGLLADLVEGWRAAATAGDVELSLRWSGAPACVVGDRLRLAQAIGNLISNAIEHGGDGQWVQVHGRRDRGAVRIEVSDGGPGLPAPVARLARRARRGRGSRGRGLAIALAIAVRHGGRLAAAPSERGARLVLQLPAAIAHARSSGSPFGEA